MSGGGRRVLRAVLGALASGAVAAACSGPPTELLVVTDTDLAVPEEIDAIRFEVDARDIGGELHRRTVSLAARDAQLPVRMTVVHSGGPTGPIELAAVGFAGGEERIRVVASARFVPGRSVLVPLPLIEACGGLEACPTGQVCGSGGRCAPIEPDAGAPSGEGGASLDVDAGAVDGGALDARAPPSGLDAAAPKDAASEAPPDAAPSCPDGCACRQHCELGCACLNGCSCELTCGSGQECTSLVCEHTGTRCTLAGSLAARLQLDCKSGASCVVDGRGVGLLDVQCRSGSRCEVDCSEATDCRVQCDDGAECLVSCAGASSCDLDDCFYDPEDGIGGPCGGDVYACGRACD